MRSLFLRRVALVPALQVLHHQGLRDAPADLLGATGRLPVPGRPYRGVDVVRKAVRNVRAVLRVDVVAVVTLLHVVVGGVDVVVTLQLVLVHVNSVGVRLRLQVVGVAGDVIRRGVGSPVRLVGV